MMTAQLWLALLPDALALTDCTVSTAAAVSFGWYSSSTGADLDTTGSIVVDCTGINGDPVLISLSSGTGGSFAPREMSRMGGGASKLQYNLFRDPARTQIWGDGILGGQTRSFTPAGPNEVVHVFGRVFQGQAVTPGSYADSVLVTVSF